MTFDTIVAKVMKRMNLSSSDAVTRIGEFVNERYRQATSSIGIEAVRLQTTIRVFAAGYAGLPEVVFNDYDKINRIQWVDTSVSPSTFRTLKELTYDELTSMPTNNGLPRAWAVKNLGAHSVTVVLDAYPTTDAMTLRVNGYTRLQDASGSTEPVFPEDFHDLLIHGAMADELRKMEKPQLAQTAEGKYENRVSDLRMFIAKSAYLDIVQGKDKPSVSWYRPWFSRVSVDA